LTPHDWSSWSLPPAGPSLRHAVPVIRRTQVLVPFAARFDLALVGDLPPEPPALRSACDGNARSSSAPNVDTWVLFWAGELQGDVPFHRAAEVIVRRPPGAAVYDTWNFGRPATNDPGPHTVAPRRRTAGPSRARRALPGWPPCRTMTATCCRTCTSW
jgi:hypothetical protein